MSDAREALLQDGFCAACPVLQGECPRCGTFWIVMPGGKRHGLTPTQFAAVQDATNPVRKRELLPNFVEQPPTDEMIAEAKQRLADRVGEPFLEARRDG